LEVCEVPTVCGGLKGEKGDAEGVVNPRRKNGDESFGIYCVYSSVAVYSRSEASSL
jgi:hypothetical protein